MWFDGPLKSLRRLKITMYDCTHIKWVNEKAENENCSAFTNLVTHEIRNIDNGRRRISSIYWNPITFRWENNETHERRMNRIEIVSFEPKEHMSCVSCGCGWAAAKRKIEPGVDFRLLKEAEKTFWLGVAFRYVRSNAVWEIDCAYCLRQLIPNVISCRYENGFSM